MTDSAAASALRRLLKRAESAHARGEDRAALPMTPTSCPEYHACTSLAEREAFEAVLLSAQRAGAIAVDMHRTGFGDARFKRVVVDDIDKLAAFLGIKTRQSRVDAAAHMLAFARDAWLVIDAVLERWRLGKPVRGKGPDAAPDLADAVRLVEARKECVDDALLRRESIRLLGDSKRAESLEAWIDLLLQGELASSGLGFDDVFAAIGLRRIPQPFLLAGSGSLHLRTGDIAICRPYIGVSMDVIENLSATPRWLLSIENQQTFFEAAEMLGDRGDGLILYSAGMPSPRWCDVYRRILAALQRETRVYHWGDIDEGGFRIARWIAEAAAAAGRRLEPWNMRPGNVDGDTGMTRVPDAGTLARMCASARAAGWAQVALDLEANPLQFEQEGMPVALPD